MRRVTFLHAVLALVSIAFAIALYRVVTAPPPADPVVAAPAQAELPAPTQATFVAPPESAFAEISARPLFSPTRRLPPPPEPEEEISTPTRPPPPNLVLIGIVIAGSEKLAVIKNAATSQTVNVALGGLVDGWVLSAITADQISLENGDEVHDYRLQQGAAAGVRIVSPENAGIGSP